MSVSRRLAVRNLILGCGACMAGTHGPVVGDPQSSVSATGVTLTLDKAPLTQLAGELTRQTGLRHRVAGPEGRRQLIVAYCQGEPAAGIRRAIANLVGWTWSRGSTEGVPVYTLSKSLNQQRLEAELRARHTGHYREVLQRMIAAKSNPDWRPTGDSAVDDQIADEDTGGVLRCAADLPPAVLNGMLSGRPFVAPASSLTGRFGESVNRVWGRVANGRRLNPRDPVRLEVVSDPTGRPDYLQLTIQRVHIRAGHAAHVYPEDASDGLAQTDIPALLRAHPELLKPLPKAPPLKWPPPPEPSFIGWNIRDLTRRTNQPFLADYYPTIDVTNEPVHPRPYRPPNHDGKRLLSAVRSFAEPDYNWRVQHKWVLLRYRWWYWEVARPAGPAGR